MPSSDARPETRRRPQVAWRDMSSAHLQLCGMPDFPGAGAVLLQGWIAS